MLWMRIEQILIINIIGNDIMDIEVKAEFSKYTIDTIATSAFGIEINSMQDTQNDFFKMGKAATYFSINQLLRFMFMLSFPNLMKVIS